MQTTKIILSQSVIISEGYSFGNLLALTLRKPVYGTIGIQDIGDYCIHTRSGWWGLQPGETPPKNSRAPYIGPEKVFQLFAIPDRLDEILYVGPNNTIRDNRRYPGGCLYENVAVSASKWAGQHDLLIALLVLYKITHDETIRLHHCGKNYMTGKAYEEACKQMMKEGYTGYSVPADDHHRVYFKTEHEKYVFWQELQFFNQDPTIGVRNHWDISVQDSEEAMGFLLDAYTQAGLQSTIQSKSWPNEKNCPRNVI